MNLLTAVQIFCATDPGDGEWRTIKGQHIFIRSGETPKQAFDRTLKKETRKTVLKPSMFEGHNKRLRPVQNPPKYAYHGTHSGNAEGIKKEGLRPAGKGSHIDFGNVKGMTYLLTDPAQAKWFAHRATSDENDTRRDKQFNDENRLRTQQGKSRMQFDDEMGKLKNPAQSTLVRFKLPDEVRNNLWYDPNMHKDYPGAMMYQGKIGPDLVDRVQHVKFDENWADKSPKSRSYK